MPVEEKVIFSCSCLAKYNIAKLKPGARFKCQKCGMMNIVPAPAAQEEIQEEIIEEPEPPPKPLSRTTVKIAMPKPAKPSRFSLRNKAVKTGYTENGEGEAGEEKATMISKLLKNKKYLFIGGGVMVVLLAVIYVIYNNAHAAKMEEIGGKAKKLLNEINELHQKQSFSDELEKYQIYVKEFKEYDLPGLNKIEKNIENLKKIIEKEAEGKKKLAELIKKKESASPDQYTDLLKEFEHFISNNSDIIALTSKAEPEAKDLRAKVAAAEKESDDKAYKELMDEIEPLREKDDYDGAITKLKDLWKKFPNKTIGLQKRIENTIKDLGKEKKSK